MIFTFPDRFSRCPEWATYLWDEFTRNGLMIVVWNGTTFLTECKGIVKSTMVYDLQRINARYIDSVQTGWIVTATGQSEITGYGIGPIGPVSHSLCCLLIMACCIFRPKVLRPHEFAFVMYSPLSSGSTYMYVLAIPGMPLGRLRRNVANTHNVRFPIFGLWHHNSPKIRSIKAACVYIRVYLDYKD